VLEDHGRPDPGAEQQGHRGAHPAGDHEVGIEIADQPPELAGVRCEPPGCQYALRDARADIQRPSAQREHSKSGGLGRMGELSVRTSEADLAFEGRSELE
jgi:hypothetical protein